MNKETKWIVTGQETSRHVATIREVCDTPGQRKELWIADVAKHHAQLIASAPELLEALEDLFTQFEHTPECDKDKIVLDKAWQAIAKARGER